MEDPHYTLPEINLETSVECTIPAEIITKYFLGTVMVVIVSVSITSDSTRAFSLQCCCHWSVPVGRGTCEEICFVK